MNKKSGRSELGSRAHKASELLGFGLFLVGGFFVLSVTSGYGSTPQPSAPVQPLVNPAAELRASAISNDSAIYQDLSDIRLPKQRPLSFDGDLSALSRVEGRYHENLPKLPSAKQLARAAHARNQVVQRPSYVQPAMQRIAQQKYTYTSASGAKSSAGQAAPAPRQAPRSTPPTAPANAPSNDSAPSQHDALRMMR